MKHKRILGYGGLGLTLIALGVAFVKPISTSNLLIRARADMGNLSVTFNNRSTVESGSIQSNSCVLSSGLQMSGIKAYATISNSSNPQFAEISRFYGDVASVVFSVDSPASNFRSLKSIGFAYRNTSYQGNMNIMWSSDNSNWTTITVACGTASQALPSGAHYLKVVNVNNSGYAYFTAFTLNYSCSDEPEPEKELSSISVNTAPTNVSYTEGEYFDPTGLVITRTYSDSTSDTYSYAGHTSEFSFSPSTSTALTASDSSVTITYDGKSCNQAITVSAAPSGLTGSYSIATYYILNFDDCTYTYDGHVLHFSYTLSGSNLTFTYVSGTNSDFGSNMLFKSGTTTNSTAVVGDDSISLKTYNNWGTAQSRTAIKI